ncbi:MAG: glycosyltransferase, partial [bacterium]
MKILFAIPLVYSNSGSFWERDLGLVVVALRKMGVDAWFCAIKGEEPLVGRPLLTATREELNDPDWWRLQTPDAIVLNTWSAPRYDGIRRAALSVGCPVIEKLDTDGVKSPRIYPLHHLRAGWIDYDRRHPFKSAIPRKFFAVAKTFATYLLPSILDRPMIRCMEGVPLFAAETPLASARVKRFLEMYDASPMPQVATIPHPVDVSVMHWDQAKQKSNTIVAVGRWDMAVKGWPLLKRIVRNFLERAPDWKIVVAGPGAEREGRRIENVYSGRFEILGSLDRSELSRELAKAKIYLLTSHLETFNIAGAEALCCGCSVVGPAQIPSSAYFAGCDSGTVSYLRSPA